MAAKLHRNIAYIVSQLRQYCQSTAPILHCYFAYITLQFCRSYVVVSTRLSVGSVKIYLQKKGQRFVDFSKKIVTFAKS